jgi:glutamyl-tRNA synthetase
VIEDADFIAKAAALLPAGDWGDTTWKAWTKSVKEETGAKGKQLFMPLRQAVTGLSHGPEMGSLLPLIGADRVKARLAGEKA